MSGRSKILGTLLLLAAPLLTGGRLPAQEIGPAQPTSWAFYVENDSFLNTDRYYTNGIRLTQTYSVDGLPQWAHTTRWMERILDRVPRCFPGGNMGRCYNFEAAWTFGQNLYTPDDILASGLVRNQRPYGAWLYYGNVLTLGKPREQHSLEIDIGVVGGSLALSEPVQSGWHSLLRSANDSETPPDPKGWDNQIKNHPGLQLIYKDRWRFKELSTESSVRYFDLVPAVSVGAGTVSVQGSVGAMARLGYNLADEFPESSRPWRLRPPPRQGVTAGPLPSLGRLRCLSIGAGRRTSSSGPISDTWPTAPFWTATSASSAGALRSPKSRWSPTSRPEPSWAAAVGASR